jgi:hypothetical protein
MKLASSTRKPAAGGRLRDAAVGGQRCKVEQLPDAPGAEAQEGVERRRVAHSEQAADVALQVGGRVVGEPQLPVVYAGIAALPEEGVQIFSRMGEAADLPQLERQQIEQRRAPGERLAHAIEQREALRPGEMNRPGSGLSSTMLCR